MNRPDRALLLALVLAPVPGGLAPARAEGPYQDYRLVTVELRSAKDLLALSQVAEPLACTPGPGLTDFIVAPHAFEAFEALGLPFVVRENNVQALVDRDWAMNEAARRERGESFFAAYRTNTEIAAYLGQLAVLDEGPLAPGHLVELFPVGTSIQGRSITGVRITTPTQPGQPIKPIFLITATQHAREWAAASSAMWIADRLARLYGSDPIVTSLLDNVDFRIIPVVNPDGYNHTFPTTQGGGGSRLWRKNRRLNSGGSYGVDLNRNWSVGWGGSGSSGSQSSDTYRGTAAFSEPETASVRDYVLTLPNIKAHIDIHTYSQLVLSPWGYTTASPPRSNELNPLTAAQVAAISAKYGTSWIGGPASTTLYLASGVAPDWSFGNRGALAWTYELRDTGFYGFTLPPDQIIPAGEEAFEGIRVLAQHIQIRLRINVPSPPASIPANQETPFDVSITTENGYSLVPDSARLLWRYAGADSFSAVPLTGGPTDFTATLPATSCNRQVEYSVVATADDGLVVRSPAEGLYTAQTPPCPGCLGDANGDQRIDFNDLTATLVNWGMAGEPGVLGDSDFDGGVDFSDISTTLAMWNTGCL